MPGMQLKWKRRTHRASLTTEIIVIHPGRYFALDMAASCFINLLFRRAALFLWMIPFEAARSRSMTAVWIAASAEARSREASARRARLTEVRDRVLNTLFRMRRLLFWRMRFFADAVFANVASNLYRSDRI
jgi:hypothetical protein